MASQFQPPVINNSGKRLYLNSKGAVVEEGDADKQTLLAAPGVQVLPEHVAAYNAYSAPVDEPDNNEGAPEAQPTEGSKALSAAPKNKAQSSPEGSK
jgi:hypothetical protein